MAEDIEAEDEGLSEVESYAEAEAIKQDVIDQYPESSPKENLFNHIKYVSSITEPMKRIQFGFLRQPELGLMRFATRFYLQLGQFLEGEGIGDCGCYNKAALINTSSLSRDGLLVKIPTMTGKSLKISGDKKIMTKKSFMGETKVEEGGEE